MTFLNADDTTITNEDGGTCAQCGDSIPTPDDVVIGKSGQGYCQDCDPFDDEVDVWGDPDACAAEGHHGVSLYKTNEGTWECSACGEQVEHTDPWETLLNEA